MPKGNKITPKQKRFCDEYLISLNATQAAIKAGYSKKTAKELGYKLVNKSSLAKYINERQELMQKKTDITQDKVLKEYAKIAFFDIRNLYTEDNTLKKIKDIDENSAGALASVESYEHHIDGEVIGVTQKAKLHSKIAALDSLCRVLGFNSPDKHEVTGKDGKDLNTVFYLPEKDKNG